MRPGLKPRFIATALLLFVLTAVGYSQSRRPVSSFRFNGKNYNRLIVDRVPDYGDGHRDGCVIMGAFDLALIDKDPQQITGKVTDAEAGTPLVTTIRIKRENGSSDVVFVDSAGQFAIAKNPSPAQMIYVETIGYRTLTIQLKSKKLF